MSLLSVLRSLELDVSDLEFIKPLEKRFTCPGCQYVLLVPIELSCGHTVCYICYDKVLKNNNTVTCPVGVDDNCKNIRRQWWDIDISVYSEVLRLKVKCPYSKYGCSDVMCLEDLERHLKGCKDIIVPCIYNCGIEPLKRRELSSPYKICSKKECEYKFYGCDFKGTTEHMAEHDEKTVHQHLKLVTVYTRTKDSDPSARQQVEEQGRQIRDLTEKLNNVTFQLNTRTEKNNVKPRGKIPSWHKEILKKNYLDIIANIRVDDIMGHLFGSGIVNDNDMDIIKTKLKSEGNREALSYLMDILSKSSHTALTTFINCLNETRYEYIAKILQEDMDNSVGGGGR